MSQNEVTREGQRHTRPGREAVTRGGENTSGGENSRRRGGRRGERLMVPKAQFRSYYGTAILQPPVWEPGAIASYFFLGGLAGASSVLGAGAQATGRPVLAKSCKTGAFAAIAASLGLLVEDLGRPLRAPMMLRTLKPTSPMSVGTWIISGYAPAAGVAALSALTGRAPRLGGLATGAAALLGPAVASYTAVLAADTAVPAWHDGYRQLPFVFTASAAAAAGGLGMVTSPLAQAEPARRAAIAGGVTELVATQVMERRMGLAGEAYRSGRARLLGAAATAFTALGVVGAATVGRRSRPAAMISGGALMAGSACTRFAVFEAGRASTLDPRYVVEPQRARLAERRRTEGRQADGPVDGAGGTVPE